MLLGTPGGESLLPRQDFGGATMEQAPPICYTMRIPRAITQGSFPSLQPLDQTAVRAAPAVHNSYPKVGLMPSRGSTSPILVLNSHLLHPCLLYCGLNPVRVETPPLLSSTWELSRPVSLWGEAHQVWSQPKTDFSTIHKEPYHSCASLSSLQS